MENNNNTSESEQMYLVTIARLSEMIDECPIPISKVAEVLDITAISANQMVHHLEEMNLITYTPYKGVEFTEIGWQTAVKLLRIRRLWEVFLVDHLKYSPDEAETLACKLEHATSADTVDRLAEFLGWPQTSPNGKPIPQNDMEVSIQSGSPISSLSAGATCTVSAILAEEAERNFLQQAGISVGCQIEILANQQDGAYLIRCDENQPVYLSVELAKKIHVKPKKLRI